MSKPQDNYTGGGYNAIFGLTADEIKYFQDLLKSIDGKPRILRTFSVDETGYKIKESRVSIKGYIGDELPPIVETPLFDAERLDKCAFLLHLILEYADPETEHKSFEAIRLLCKACAIRLESEGFDTREKMLDKAREVITSTPAARFEQIMQQSDELRTTAGVRESTKPEFSSMTYNQKRGAYCFFCFSSIGAIIQAFRWYGYRCAQLYQIAIDAAMREYPETAAQSEPEHEKAGASLKLFSAPSYIMPRDQLSSFVFDNRITKTADVLHDIFKIEVYQRHKTKKPAYIYAIVTADGGAFPAELGAMHRIYFNAAVSLFHANKTITPAMIWEFLTDSRPSKAKIAEIEQCIEDMRSMKLSVNLGDYATDHGIAKDVEWNDYILPVSRVRARVSGQLVTGYTAHDVSAFPSLRFAQTSGQIDSVPVELITNIPGIERVNNQTILLCDILLSYTRKKNPNRNDHIMKLSTIYSKLGIDTQQSTETDAETARKNLQKLRQQTKRARETLQKILAHWMWQGEIFTFAFRKASKGEVDAVIFCKSADEMELFPGMNWARITGRKADGEA